MKNNKGPGRREFSPRGTPLYRQQDIDQWEKHVPQEERTDLFRRRQFEQAGIDAYVREIARNVHIQTILSTLERGFVARTVPVGTTPTLLIESPQPRGYIILNPTLTAGITTSVTVHTFTNQAAGTGDTTVTPINVGNFNTGRLWFNVSAYVGGPPTIQIDALSQDPISLNWADTQTAIFGGPASPVASTPVYASLGALGIDLAFAIRWTVAGAGDVTGTVSMLLKDGLPGTSTGVEPTVFLGASSGVSSVSGFPLLAGNFERFYFRENTPLYGVALAASEVRIFELS